MQIDFVARNLDLEDSTRHFARERIERAIRFLREPIELRVAVEGVGGEKHLHAAEIHVRHRGGVAHARSEAVELREAIGEAAAAVETQARRGRERSVDRKRRASREAVAERQWPVDVLARESLRAGAEPRIVKSTRIPIETLSIDEAALRLDESKHEFVVFFDRDRGRVSVLFRRRDDDYGLIAPEF